MPEWTQQGRTFTNKEQLEITLDALGLEGKERERRRDEVKSMMNLPMWKVREALKRAEPR